MEIKKILVGTDFSKQAEAGLTQALNLARALSAELVLVHCASSDSPSEAELPSDVTTTVNNLLKAQLVNDAVKLEELREYCRKKGVETSHQIMHESPADGIPRAASEHRADLIILGTRGRTGLAKILLGSVAERVVRSGAADTLIARPGPTAEGGYQKLLVPTDFSETAERALQRAIAMAADGGTVELFHCWRLPSTATSRWASGAVADSVVEPLKRDFAAHAEQQGKRLVDKYQTDRINLVFAHTEDTPVHGVQARLEKGDYELVVTGSRGHKGFKRWLVGSVAEGTVRYSPCSVLVVQGAKTE